MTLPPLPPHPVPLCVIVLAIVAASTDLTARRIPNRLISLGLAVALAVQMSIHGPLAGALDWLIGAACGLALLLPFYLLGGMAAGDVKLLMMIGAWVGPALTWRIALATFLIGGIWSLLIVLCRGRFARLLANLRQLIGGLVVAPLTQPNLIDAQSESVGSIPYGVAIAAGTLGMLFAAAL
ncbi:prepilin peptidase [Paraburkholderia sp. MM5384-R2]|uniref:A24 family peptidase n=1 Tax=Paraburkholderia sp. MM5384-R2 TaxID=2723097 RepID=UPI001609C95E|nr:prepilin peptidase [Paraburkholderia sp. MM5384-R2]MBB5497650.1 prepilin peptidase CpaA [Paraburkholderia sp. MM5384-R2]